MHKVNQESDKMIIFCINTVAREIDLNYSNFG